MAKGNPNSVAVQYKVHLKPTDVGLLVMKRMERPHLDKSAELRRFIELGYAAEQAGFILDGTVLRHAGKAWETQPVLTVTSDSGHAPEPPVTVADRPPPALRKSADGASGVPFGTAAELSPAQADTATPGSGAGAGPSLKSKLRGLSG